MADITSETMLDALADAVAEAAGVDFPALKRNETLDDGLDVIDAELYWLNMVDGDLRVTEELLGGAGSYELEQDAVFEIVVKAADEAHARAGMAAMLKSIQGVIMSANDGDTGAIGQLYAIASVTGLKRELLAGQVPGLKGVALTVTLTFTSDEPF